MSFTTGDYVRVKKSRSILTGTIISGKDVKGRYSVKYDQSTNDTRVLEQGLYYEDELEPCEPPKKN